MHRRFRQRHSVESQESSSDSNKCLIFSTEPAQRQHSPLPSVATQTLIISSKKQLNSLLFENAAKEKHLQKLSFEKKLLKPKKSLTKSFQRHRKKTEISDMLQTQQQETQTLFTVRDRTLKGILQLKKNIYALTDVIRKFTGVSGKAVRSKQLAKWGYEGVNSHETHVQKKFLKSKREFKALYSEKDEEHREYQGKFTESLEVLKGINTQIGLNRGKSASLVTKFSGILSELRVNEKINRSLLTRLGDISEDLGKLNQITSDFTMNVHNFSSDAVLRHYSMMDSEETSLCKRFNELTCTFNKLQNECEELQKTLNHYKSSSIQAEPTTTLHSLMTSIENTRTITNPLEFEATSLTLYVGVLNIASRFLTYIETIDRSSSFSSRVSITMIAMGEHIKELTQSFSRKHPTADTAKSQTLAGATTSVSRDLSSSPEFSVSLSDQRTVPLYFDEEETRKFSRFLKGFPTLLYFLNQDYLQSYLQTKTSTQQLYSHFPDLLSSSFCIFHGQISRLFESFTDLIKFINQHRENVSQRVTHMGSEKLYRFRTLRKKGGAPLNPPNIKKDVSTSKVMNKFKIADQRSSKKQLKLVNKSGIGQVKSLDFLSKKDILSELIQVEKKISAIKQTERQVLSKSFTTRLVRVRQPWREQVSEKQTTTTQPNRLRNAHSLVPMIKTSNDH